MSRSFEPIRNLALALGLCLAAGIAGCGSEPAAQPPAGGAMEPSKMEPTGGMEKSKMEPAGGMEKGKMSP